MKICFIAHAASPHTHKWLNYFADLGYTLYLIPVDDYGDQDALTGLSSKVEVVPIPLKAFYFKRFDRTIRHLICLKRFLRQTRPDILHCCYLGPGAWYGTIAGFHPTVVTAMGVDILGTKLGLYRNWQERILTPLTIHRADLVTGWSRNLIQCVLPYVRSGVDAQVVNVGVNRDIFRRTLPRPQAKTRLELNPEGEVIFSCRGLAPIYNLETIVRAMPSVLRYYPRSTLVISRYFAAIYPDYEARIRELIIQQGVGESVRFVDPVRNERMAEYYNAADVTISLPINDNLGISVFESMACLTPCIVADLPEYDKEIYRDGENVLMVPPTDYVALASAIVKCFTDRSLRERIVANGWRTVCDRGDYHREMAKMDRLYQSLIS